MGLGMHPTILHPRRSQIAPKVDARRPGQLHGDAHRYGNSTTLVHPAHMRRCCTNVRRGPPPTVEEGANRRRPARVIAADSTREHG
jgi:hypothetical protein